MILFPAIDLLQGECVRLYRGEYDSAHKVAESPLSTALSFQEQGAKFLHVVDLDGARDGKPANRETVRSILNAVDLPVQLGGGIREMSVLQEYLDIGVRRVVLGSAALRNKAFTKQALARDPERVAVGIDAKDGKVCVEGWRESSDTDYLDFAKELEQLGARYLIFTDISRDGMLSGPNLDALSQLMGAVDCRITASGGVRDLEHIRALCEMDLYGAICGKALYTGNLDLKKALAIAERSGSCLPNESSPALT